MDFLSETESLEGILSSYMDHRTQGARQKRNELSKLWAEATDEQLREYASKKSKFFGGSYEKHLRRAKRDREKAQKERQRIKKDSKRW